MYFMIINYFLLNRTYIQKDKKEIITPKMAWFSIHDEVCYSQKIKAAKMNHLDANEMQFLIFHFWCFSISVCKTATYFSVGGDSFHIPTRHILYLNVNLYSRIKRPTIYWSRVLYHWMNTEKSFFNPKINVLKSKVKENVIFLVNMEWNFPPYRI